MDWECRTHVGKRYSYKMMYKYTSDCVWGTQADGVREYGAEGYLGVRSGK
jgi:hypothetical protein